MPYHTPQKHNKTKVGSNSLQTAKCHFPRLFSHTMENHNQADLQCWTAARVSVVAHGWVINYNPALTIGRLWEKKTVCLLEILLLYKMYRHRKQILDWGCGGLNRVLNKIKHFYEFVKQPATKQKWGKLMNACNDFILKNSLKQIECLYMRWINDPLGRKVRAFTESTAFQFSFSWCFITSFCGWGMQVWPASALINAHAHIHTGVSA